MRARRGTRAAGGGTLLALAVIAVVALVGIPGGGPGFVLPDSVRTLPQAPTASRGEPFLQRAPSSESELVRFLSFVVDDINGFWAGQFREVGASYRETSLAIFDEAVSTGCGPAMAEVGPFYCPVDQTAYLDTEFFEELERRFEVPGDFAQAYVVAHEIGHHIQRLTGIDSQVRQRAADDPGNANVLSVAQELQADCFAGVWAHSTYERDLLEPGDVEEGLQAAAAVGDDRIQERTTGRIDPERWTHGSAAQRQEWFSRGFESGEPGQCNTLEEEL